MEFNFHIYGSEEEISSKLYLFLQEHYHQSKILHGNNIDPLFTVSENDLYCISEANLELARQMILLLLSKGAESRQISIFASRNSLNARIIASEIKISLFSIGDVLELESFLTYIQNLRENHFKNLVLNEIESACESGALGLLEYQLKIANRQNIERARFAASLAINLGANNNIVIRTLRLALFYELFLLPDWQKIVHSSRKFWPIKELLEKKMQSPASIWTSDMPEEIVYVDAANIIAREFINGGNEIRKLIREYSAQLPFKFRTNLRLSIEKQLTVMEQIKNAAA